MQEGDDRSNLPDICYVTVSKQANANDVVEAHLDEVILARSKEVGDERTKVISHRNQYVLLQLRAMPRERIAVEGATELTSSSQARWHVWLVLEDRVAPSDHP